eukprot:gene15238-15384_t
MLTRRIILAGALALVATGAFAEDWKAKYPEINYAVIPEENASGTTDRYAPFVNYLSKELGVKVNLRIVQDYAALIEGQRSGNIQIAYYGPASFARARITGVKTDAFVIDVNSDGSKGYYSVFYTLATNPATKIEDLKGKNLGLVDPNSTSGNNMPRFVLDQMHIKPEDFFGKVVFTGSHENAVLALKDGTVDVAANYWNAEHDSNLSKMLNKKMLKNADGTEMKESDFKIVLKSPLIVNAPTAYLSDLPDDMKAAIKKAFLEAASKDKAAYDKLSDGKNKPWEATENKTYDGVIELVKFVDTLKKK